MALSHNPKIVTNGIVLCLDAANPKSYPGSGTTWSDLSGNDNDGTLVNGVGYDAANNGSLTFDGSNDYVDLGDKSLWNSFNDSITIELFFMFGGFGAGSFPRLVAKQLSSNTTANSCFQLGIGNDSKFRWAISTDTGRIDSRFETVTKTVEQNVLYHLAATYDGSNMYMRVNGEEIFSNSLTGNIITSSQPLTLGLSYYNTSTNYVFSGNIYNTKIYNRALTEAEIKQNFNALRGRYGL